MVRLPQQVADGLATGLAPLVLMSTSPGGIHATGAGQASRAGAAVGVAMVDGVVVVMSIGVEVAGTGTGAPPAGTIEAAAAAAATIGVVVAAAATIGVAAAAAGITGGMIGAGTELVLKGKTPPLAMGWSLRTRGNTPDFSSHPLHHRRSFDPSRDSFPPFHQCLFNVSRVPTMVVKHTEIFHVQQSRLHWGI
jgi:hypothetical protein